MKIFFIALVLCFCMGMSVNSQQNEKKTIITGTILDIEGTPVEQAIILVDGKETKVRSDSDGNYSIKVKKGADKIGIVAFGTGIIEEEIDGRTQIDFFFSREMVELPDFEKSNEIKSGEALVNTGYGTIKQKHVASAVGFLDVEHSKRKYTTLTEILMNTPGLMMVNGGFIVAGATRFGGYVAPLYVVDNLACEYMPSLHPSEVASVTVLKDGAAAIYGTRAFGGVIIITTRIP